MRKAIVVIVLVCVGMVCGAGIALASAEVSRAGMVATASSISYGQPADAIDNNNGTFWQFTVGSGWLKVDMLARYSIDQVRYRPRTGNQEIIKDFNIFITDDATTDPANWGAPVSSGQFPNEAGERDITFTAKTGRFIALQAVSTWAGPGTIEELRLFGTRVSPAVDTFTAADQDTGNALFSNSLTLDVVMIASEGANPVDGYMITESADAPLSDDEGWLMEAPIAYTCSGEGDISLYAWVRDTAGEVSAGKLAAIFVNTVAPTISDIIAAGGSDTSAVVVWKTDEQAYGRLRYSIDGGDELVTDWEAAHGTIHTGAITGLYMGGVVTYVIESNEVSSAEQTYTHEVWAEEIPKPGITTFAVPDALPGSWNWSGNLLDGQTGGNMWHTGGTPAWVRFDLGAKYRVQRIEHQPREYYKDVYIYMTDSASADRADWGDPVLITQFPNVNQRLGADFIGYGRYVIFDARTSWTGSFSMFEVWLYGLRIDPTVDTFVATDQSTDSELFTSSPTVNIMLDGHAPDGPIAGYAVTETPEEPESWSAESPFTYTITGEPGTITLYGWVKGQSGAFVNATHTIIYDPNNPVASDVGVFGLTETEAIVTWTTDLPAVGRVRYQAEGEIDWLATPWETTGLTVHARTLTGLAIGTTYKYIIESNEVVDPERSYVHETFAGEIPKSIMTASTNNYNATYPPAFAIDDFLGTFWYTGGTPSWLRIDLGSTYRVMRLGYYRRDYIKDFAIYVTDSPSLNRAEWDEPALVGRFDNVTGRSDVDFIGYGRYVILDALTSWNGYYSAMEIWLYGENVDTRTESFAVADQTSGNTAVTDSETVNVIWDDVPATDATIDGWMILETPDTPFPEDDWLTTKPATYTIISDPGDVTLYAWLLDSNGKVAGGASRASHTILLEPAAPVVSDVAVYGVTTDSAVVTWTTDVDAYGRVRFTEQGFNEWVTTDWENRHGTTHSVLIGNLAWEAAYEIIIESNEKAEPSFVYTHDSETPEIPKNVMTPTASSTGAGNVAFAIDDLLGENYWQAGASPCWLRLDLGARYRVVRMGHVPRNADHTINNYEIYVTDSTSTNKAEWGVPVATGQFPHTDVRTDVSFYGVGRYVILWGDVWQSGPAVGELWLYGLRLGPSVTEFSVADQSTGSTLFTNSLTVDVTLTVVPVEGTTVAEYLIREDPGQPEADDPGWSAELPATYEITGWEGPVTCYAWAKDSTGAIGGGRTASIYLSTETPFAYDITIVPGIVGTATVLWSTDIAAFGSVQYRAIGDVDWITVAESTRGTSHRAVMTGLDTDNFIYEVVVIDDEVAEPAIYYPENPLIPTVTAFSVSDQSTGNMLFTNSATVDVSITAEAAEGQTLDGLMITETPDQPAAEDSGWMPAITSYTITGFEGNVTLYAWAKDAAGHVSTSVSDTIYFSTAVPAVSGLVISDNGDGTATASWTTDVAAFGAAKYGPVSMTGATPSTAIQTAVGTEHSVTLLGITAGTNYKVILVNNEVSSDPIYWPKPWPIEGDANMDCRVNILDLIYIRNKLNQAVGTDDNWKADVNEDTRINILDLIFVRNKLNTQCPP